MAREIKLQNKTETSIKTLKNRKKNGDPRVRVFSEWWLAKFQHKYHRDYVVTNWAKHFGQIKNLLNLGYTFEDLQYLAIEFLLDDDPFITGSEGKAGAGHNIGMLLTKIGQNSYRKYLGSKFREDNQHHIILEDGTPKYPGP